jgi:hypothetical protein
MNTYVLKKIGVIYLMAGLLLIISFQNVVAQSLTYLWRSEKVFQIPESVLYNSSTKNIYVSNISGKPVEKNKQGFISLLDKYGNIIKLKWITGLNAPKGMTIIEGKLYVTDIDRICVIDINSAKIDRFINIKGSEFLNDIISDSKGNLYVSDMLANTIYKISKDKYEKWLFNLTDLIAPNGMNFYNGKIIIGTNKGILAVIPESKKVNLIIENEGGIDGLIPLKNRTFIISDWHGKIQLVGNETKPKLLRDTTKEKINAADLGFIYEDDVLLIPTFYDNRIEAMKLKQ